jgi:hypothetical protein
MGWDGMGWDGKGLTFVGEMGIEWGWMMVVGLIV